MASSGHATGQRKPLSSRPVGCAASETALPHTNASAQQATSSTTSGCTLPLFLYVASFDGSSMEAFDQRSSMLKRS
jgi:hypothetical protein